MSAKQNAAIAETLQKAVRLHQAGQIDKAERLYDTVLKKSPSNIDALNLKGVIAHTQNRYTDALSLFDRATVAVPTFAEAHFNKANSLKALDRHEDALAAYTAAINLKPDYTDARLNAGTLLQKMGRTDDAIAAFREMARIAPADPRGHYNLGVCLTETLLASLGDKFEAAADEAETALKRAVTLSPQDAKAHFAYANLFSKRGQHDKAVTATRNAIKYNPNWPQAWSNLGEMLRKEKKCDEAIKALKKARELLPTDTSIQYNLATAQLDGKVYDEAEKEFLDLTRRQETFTDAHINLAILYQETRRNVEALNILEQSLSVDPNIHKAYANLGAIFSDLGWTYTALVFYDKAISLMEKPDVATRYYRSIAALRLGLLFANWPLLELRFDWPDTGLSRRAVPPEYWGGEDLSGKHIVVWTEQGLGDEALYASILPNIVARAGQCTIECSERMVPVFARSFPAATVVGYKASNLPVTPAEGVDYQIPLASLGQHFRPDFASFPSHTGYLKADPDKVSEIRARYDALAKGRRIVGLSWRSKNEKVGEAKSTDLNDMAAVLQVPGVMFVNLQYGECAEELAEVHKQFGVEIIHDDDIDPLKDMDGFFAQVSAMDLVVSTSNTTAHVAGAQNIPVWVLLPHGKSLAWYWFLRRTDSPWYPSARLMRADHKLEEGPARWRELIERTATELTHWTEA